MNYLTFKGILHFYFLEIGSVEFYHFPMHSAYPFNVKITIKSNYSSKMIDLA